MFQFLNMMGNYDTRKVGRNDYPWGMISTCYVNDGAKDYETAVQHDQYGEQMVIVENYDTKEAAARGHKKWVKTMTAKKLPAKLVDCMNCEIAQLIQTLQKGKKITRKLQRKTNFVPSGNE